MYAETRLPRARLLDAELRSRKQRATAVVVDTSAVLCCLADGRDLVEALEDAVEGEVELVVPEVVVKELEKLAQGRGARGALARVALELIRRAEGRTVRIAHHAEGDADTAVLKVALEEGAYVATADTQLAARSRALGLPLLLYRSAKKRFEPS
jgi:rRNA-processing protein FCF1